jgi:hypothetical protein
MMRAQLEGGAMLRPKRTDERLVALFLLGVFLFTPPVLALFNSATSILGLPLLYCYLFTAWAAVIALAGLIMERTSADADGASTGQPPAIGTQDPKS